jgi:hypothetical protein
MASIRVERHIDVPPAAAWEALRDWGALHTRLVPGFVVDTQIDGTDRIVTFFNGTVVRELLVDCDEQSRRLVWSVREGPYSHHNGAAQMHDDGSGGTLYVWVADLLPDELAERTGAMMEQGANVVKQTLEAGVLVE